MVNVAENNEFNCTRCYVCCYKVMKYLAGKPFEIGLIFLFKKLCREPHVTHD
jgi:hypothetical protein